MDELMPPEPVMPTDGQLDFDGEAEENQIKIITRPVSAVPFTPRK
jgi:hypothetical protein